MALHVLSMGRAHPETQISNEFLEQLGIESSAAWIKEKLGVEVRCSTLSLDYIRTSFNEDVREAERHAACGPTELGVRAARQALDGAGVAASQVGLVVSNCCNPAAFLPSQSQLIADELGAASAQAHEVFTSCPAFALQLDFLSHFEEKELPEYILCITTAAVSQKVNYRDRSDSAIWGDGAAAALVSPSHQGRLKVVETTFMADPARSGAVVVDTFDHFYQDGRAVRDFSVRQTVRLIKAAEKAHEIDWSRDVFIGHQANKTMLQQIVTNRKIPEKNHWHNVTFRGNQAAAGAPATLAEHWDELQMGQKVLVAVVGAGLSWGSVLFHVVN